LHFDHILEDTVHANKACEFRDDSEGVSEGEQECGVGSEARDECHAMEIEGGYDDELICASGA